MTPRKIAPLATMFLLTACQGDVGPSGRADTTIHVGVLPNQSNQALSVRFSGLTDYLENETGLSYVIDVADDYDALLAGFVDGRFDLALMGGLTFVTAEEAVDAEPLVMRDTDMNFRSCYVIAANDPRESLEEFEGGSLLFGPRLSTSGHLMPRLFLRDLSIVPEDFFANVEYSSGHDRTAVRVGSGESDIGVMNCLILDLMFEQGMLGDKPIRLLTSTPTYTNYVWTAQREMDVATRISITDAFLALDAANEEHIELLQSLGANAYLPAGRADFDRVREAAATFPIIL